ncbi:MAG: trypsin-like peptidase domain-containing protein [Myxococcales bacterium]|nr:trypsin-like peptidase domain-containing protein [Myxococcales bacterium]
MCAAAVALAVCWALVAGCKRTEPSDPELPSGAVIVPASAVPLPPIASGAPVVVPGPGGALSFAPLVKRSEAAVVTIKAWVKRENAFGREVSMAEGLGTGFVYDAKGLILTNNHVIENAAEIAVSFTDGREFSGTVVGTDKPTDIAVVKVATDGLSPLPLGDSDALEVGDWVVAIGNPFGLEHTVSAGILSAKGRTRDDVKGLDPAGYFNFLQTDASINPGNSGGPLLDLAGRVVGINSAVRANANNIGFAIPINMVRQLLPMLLKDGRVRRSAIGVFVESLTQDDAKRLGRPARQGALVKSLVPGGPAERAGLAREDVILAFDGKAVKDPNELRWLASIAGVNNTVSVRVARADRVFDVKMVLGELPDPDEER